MFDKIIQQSIINSEISQEKDIENMYYISLLEAIKKYPNNFTDIDKFPQIINRTDIMVPICKKCNTPKKAFIRTMYENVSSKPILLPVPCECENKKRIELEDKIKKEKENDKIKKRLSDCFSSYPIAANRDKYFANLKTNSTIKTIDNFINYIESTKFIDSENQKKKGIGFCGNSYTGKTYSSIYLLHKLIEKGYTAKYMPMQDFINEVSKNPHLVSELAKYDYVCIDDFRLNIVNPVTKEQFLSLLNKLIGNEHNLIFSTNLPKETFKIQSNNPDAKTYARINFMCNIVTTK